MKKLSNINHKRKDLLKVLKGNTSVYSKLEILEKELQAFPQVETEVNHYYGDGVVVRELKMPAGSFAIGRIHKFDHVSIMVSGELVMWTEFDDVVHLKGYNPVVAKAGIKRAGYVLEDILWVTAHKLGEGTDEKDIVDYLTVATYDEFTKFKLENLDPLEIENDITRSRRLHHPSTGK